MTKDEAADQVLNIVERISGVDRMKFQSCNPRTADVMQARTIAIVLLRKYVNLKAKRIFTLMSGEGKSRAAPFQLVRNAVVRLEGDMNMRSLFAECSVATYNWFKALRSTPPPSRSLACGRGTRGS